MTDCMNMVGDPGGAYASVHLVNYFVNVYLAGSFTTDDLELAGGWIRNTADDQDITVTNSLNWTADVVGGQTVGGTQYSGTLHLDGSTATIAPVGAGTITTGDTISFENGAQGTVSAGNLVFAGGTGVVVNADCSMDVAPDGGTATFSVRGAGTDPQKNWIKAGGSITVTGPGTWYGNNVPLLNDGGTFKIQGEANADFVGSVGPAGQTGSMRQTAGTTVIENGSVLTVQSGAYLAGGQLSTAAVASLAAGDQYATISGNVIDIGATIILGDANYSPAGGHIFSGLYVDGNVTWTGGAYRVSVGWDSNNTKDNDWWRATGTFTITGGATGAKLGPAPTVNPGTNSYIGVLWDVLWSDTGITFTTSPSQLAFELPAQGTSWANALDGTGSILQLSHA